MLQLKYLCHHLHMGTDKSLKKQAIFRERGKTLLERSRIKDKMERCMNRKELNMSFPISIFHGYYLSLQIFKQNL